MHAAIEKDSAAGRREAHEKARRVVHVEILRTHQERRTDQAGADLVVRVAVAWVEAAAVTDHHLEPWMLRRHGFDAPALAKIERERLFAEHVLAGVKRLNDVLGMQRRRRDQEYRVDVGLSEERRIIGVKIAHRQRVFRPGKLVGDRAARGDKLGRGYALREILGVAAAEAAKADDADAQTRCGGHGFRRAEFIRPWRGNASKRANEFAHTRSVGFRRAEFIRPLIRPRRIVTARRCAFRATRSSRLRRARALSRHPRWWS